MNCSLVTAFLLLLQAAPVQAQYNFALVDQLLDANKKELGGSVAAVVFKDGKPIYKKESPDIKIETPEPIGYSSKWLTAALVMSFVDKGELSLDDPVSKYLPVFTAYSKSYITLRHCLAEITGIESGATRLGRMVQKKKFASLEEEVNYFAAHKDIVTNPGQEFFYGEVGYNIAGRVLEVISKRKSFSKLMQERITKPLGMKKTNFATENGAENPSRGAVSTAGDYARFLTMLLNNGEANGKVILSKEAIKKMEKVQFAALPVKSTPKAALGLQYGYGSWVQESDGKGNSTVIASPGVYGTWPYIDRCRNYACVIITPPQDAEQKQDVYLRLKEEIDKLMGAGDCK